MKQIRKLKWMFVLILSGWTCLAYGAYPSAPTISTSGSSAYTSIATAINSWKNAWSPPASSSTSAYNKRSIVIDQVEATILAASKATITDAEYDVLADALYFWLHQVAAEGTTMEDPRGGWYITGIGIWESWFSGYGVMNCVWELTESTVPIMLNGSDTGYGPMLGEDVRLVLFTNKSESTIVRNTDVAKVMFSTNGSNSKLLILGRKNHKISISGGKNFADPTSYSTVLNRASQYTSTTGNEVIVNGGSLLTAYTTFKQNVATDTHCHYTYSYYDPVWNYYAPTYVENLDGGAIAISNNVNQIGLYKTDIKNNAVNNADHLRFGGGISLRDISSISDGVYLNKCSIKGNFTHGHGGGLSVYFDGGNSSEKIIIRDTEFAYNCQADDQEHHGGGIFYRDTGRKMELYNCTFTGNYAHGATAGGAGISLEGHVLLKNCAFNGNYANNSFGGAIYTRPVFDDQYGNKIVDLKIDGCSFTNNQCIWTNNDPNTGIVARQSSNIERGSGGAIMVDIFHGTFDSDATQYNVSVDIYGNSVFTNNTADRNGGAIAVVMMGYTKLWSLTHASQITSNLKITSATINGNHVTNKSVPAYTYSASGGSVTGVTKNGGAIYLAHTTLTVNGGTIGASSNPNYATLGGGAYINDANLVMGGGNLCYNNATKGGGVYIENGNLSMTGGGINNNTASNNGGGAFINIGSVLMNGGQVNNNAAVNGAGLYVNGSSASCTLNSGNIQGNTASTYGGGLYMAGGSFNMQNGSLSSNVATSNDGGGAYIGNNGTVVINGGTIQGNKALNGNGGGFYVNPGASKTTTINSSSANTTISSNQAKNGGGAYVNSGTLTVAATNGRSVTVQSNSASSNGGGLFVAAGTLNLTSALLSANSATSNGGGVYMSNGTVNMNTTIEKNTANMGGGAYMGGGTFNMNGGTIGGANATYANTATTNGGGLYMAGGSFIMQNGSMSYNVATNNDGGGLYLNSGTINLSGASTVIRANKAKSHGGGVYIGGGNFTMSGGNIGGTSAQGNSITSAGGYGGGLYISNGTATLNGGTISGNSAANGYGGGVYMNGGTCTIYGGAYIGGTSANYANSAKYGGGIYTANGAISVRGGHIDYNNATDGGGIYSNGPTATVTITKEGSTLSYLQYNTAANGGGIYANRGTVTFTDGNINYNYASNAGGGMYVNDEGSLYMKGNAMLNRNHVPTGKAGGGIYLKGVITVGEEPTKALGTITAKDNFAYTTSTPDTYVITDETRNNVYLPAPVVDHANHRDVITVIYNGISTASKVGFSVPSNYVPVIYCANNHVPCTVTGYEDYTTSQYFLHQFSTGMSLQDNLFDDTHRYVAVHYVNQPLIFDPDHVYLYGFWTNIVVEDPTDGHYEEHLDDIDTPEKLAYFISYVNGINDCAGHPHPDAVGNITADIDMSQYGWVPIGELTNGFQGTLNGNGHTITGIHSLVYGDHLTYGIVGQLNGGTVKDLFVKDAVFSLEYKDGLVIGGLVGDATNGGLVENSEISCTILAMHPNTIMGGLIGRMGHGTTPAPTVHSTIAIAEMTGCDMGGLVGHLEKGSLYNSFCNPKFNLLETTEDISGKYIGGLVAVNRGTVENCYARLRGTMPSHNFGILVGDNTDGTVNFCYAPSGMNNYKKVGNNPVGSGNYAASQLPYLYRHRDTQVEATNDYVPTGSNADRQMMVVLNKWVETKNGATGVHPTYTKWGRPWQASDALKPINDDYPVLRMPLVNAVASSQGDPYLAYNDIDVLLNNYTAAGDAIWMYNSDDDVQGNNSTSDAKLYIEENVALINANPLKAYVSITLDNSAGSQGMNPTYFPDVTDETDWHMVSTSLADAPLGINYTDGTAYDFDYGHPEGMPYYRFYPKDDAKHGYFPSHRYGETYSADDSSPTAGGNYYNEWDFYSYCEPAYHWINFKRNSASHHYMNLADHESIVYDNESQMIPGKGYFAATREETLLQCFGTLNHDEVDYSATMSAGLPRHGYNLLGNPYQAYLNFDAFAWANSGDVDALWDDETTASYTILDEDEPETGSTVETILGRKPVYYRTYNFGCTSNPGVYADGFIHPHQGFFVRLQDREAANVYFYPDQRDASVTGKFRSAREKVDYPLVNLFAMEDNGNADVVTVELGRPDKGGALLMQSLRTGNGKIWCRYDDKDYTIAFTQPGVTEVPIRFETVEDTEYTLSWNTLHGDFSYMHLIDNKTGADIDCLATDHYRFSAKKSDYTSRFKLVFDYTGIEEPEVPEPVEGPVSFAFQMGDELVVTGEGMLQVFDVTGRMVMSRELHGVQSTMPMGNMSNGVYVLRLTNGKQSQVQKMVISK